MISWRLKAALALFVFVVSALASDIANGRRVLGIDIQESESARLFLCKQRVV
jgi:hypothetical protein